MVYGCFQGQQDGFWLVSRLEPPNFPVSYLYLYHTGFVRWASEQVAIYAESFRRQVYGVDQDRKVIGESLDVTKSHGAMVTKPTEVVPLNEAHLNLSLDQLRDVGLDFSFMLDGLLRPQLPPMPPMPAETVANPRPKKNSAVAQARKSIFVQSGSNPYPSAT